MQKTCPSCGGVAYGQEIKDKDGNVTCIRYECQRRAMI